MTEATKSTIHYVRGEKLTKSRLTGQKSYPKVGGKCLETSILNKVKFDKNVRV